MQALDLNGGPWLTTIVANPSVEILSMIEQSLSFFQSCGEMH